MCVCVRCKQNLRLYTIVVESRKHLLFFFRLQFYRFFFFVRFVLFESEIQHTKKTHALCYQKCRRSNHLLEQNEKTMKKKTNNNIQTLFFLAFIQPDFTISHGLPEQEKWFYFVSKNSCVLQWLKRMLSEYRLYLLVYLSKYDETLSLPYQRLDIRIYLQKKA